ncbi:MAG: NUDIX hydrolase, partial [Anaerococcus sp.]|nr:NUDIX hydrolase [Anaerococcus sp.]
SDDLYIFHGDINLDDLLLQKEEVADARWENLEGVLALRRADKFVGYKESFIRFLFDLSRDNRYVEI